MDASAIRDVDAATYKKLVEARIANNNGSTFTEVFVVVSVLLSTTTVSSAVTSALGLRHGSVAAVALEIAMCGGAVLLGITAPTPQDSFVRAAVLAGLMLISVAYQWWSSRRRAAAGSAEDAPALSSGGAGSSSARRSYFSDFRGALMLLTAVSILAVDFTIFPQRHMKTETYGVSLMDTGVGCFVFSAGFALGGKLQSSTEAGFSRRWLGSAVPLALLGGVRMLIIFYTDYQEHLTEYGKHWNFFCTLAVMPVIYVAIESLTALLERRAGPNRIMRPKHKSVTRRSGFQAVVFALVYQALLSLGGLTAYIDSPHRRSLFEANKEGIFSSVGYVAIFLAALEFGRFMLAASPRMADQRRTAIKALAVDGLLWAATLACDAFVQPCSRRLCNLAYVLFTLALCVFFIACFMLLETVTSASEAPSSGAAAAVGKWKGGAGSVGDGARGTYLLEAINRNQLFIFLVSNLSTGAVNLSMRTIFAGPTVALAVLSAYIIWFSAVAVALHRLGWTVKAW